MTRMSTTRIGGNPIPFRGLPVQGARTDNGNLGKGDGARPLAGEPSGYASAFRTSIGRRIRFQVVDVGLLDLKPPGTTTAGTLQFQICVSNSTNPRQNWKLIQNFHLPILRLVQFDISSSWSGRLAPVVLPIL